MDTLLSQINMIQMIIFITAAEECSFSGAGHTLHMTQSAITKSISRLEQQLELRLFHRTTRRMELTAAGQYLYSQWKPLLLHMQDDYRKARTISDKHNHALRIGTTSTANPELYFWPTADRFREQYPETELIVESDSMEILREKLIHHEYDLIFLPHFEHYVLDAQKIPWKWAAIGHVFAYMSQNHPLAQKAEVTVKDLQDANLLILDEAHNPNYLQDIRELFASEGCTPHITQSLPNAYTIKARFRTIKEIIIADEYFDFPPGSTACRRPVRGHYNGIICAWNLPLNHSGLKHFIEFIDARLPMPGNPPEFSQLSEF